VEDLTEFLWYVWNEWLLDHIKAILVTFIAFTIGWFLGRDNVTNTGVVAAINVIWVVDAAFSGIAFVDWAIHKFVRFLEQLWESLQDLFRW
jgi:hypothetical protein